MDGFINFLKPPGMTSSDGVLQVRKLLPRGTKVGHGGTLDPDAAGVLPVCIGKAARLFDYFIDKEKQYLAEVTFGIATDTQDATGKVIRRREGCPTEEEIRAALPALTGLISQTPPAYSAIKQGGKRLYQLARQGQEVQVQPRQVQVLALTYMGSTGYNRHRIGVKCRKGVYVRTLMHDLGEMLGCGGHMSFLLRTSAGAFALEDALTLEELKQPGALERGLMPMDAPLGHMPSLVLGEKWALRVKNGNPVAMDRDEEPGTFVRVYLGEVFAGIGQVGAEGQVKFKAMLL